MSTTPESGVPRQTGGRSSPFGQGRVRGGALVAVAALVGVVVWLIVGRSENSNPSPRGTNKPIAISPQGLSTLARAAGQPIYWLGTQKNTTYELSRTSNSRVYIRYLPPGVKVGDSHAYLTVGTYQVRNAFGIIDGGTRQHGSVRISLQGGGVGLYRPSSPGNVYVAYPGSDFEVEVWSPTSGAARRLVESGRLQAVGPTSRGAASSAIAVSANKLKSRAASLGQPIYWAGSRPGVTYEYTRLSDGRIYVRYLPSGVAVGAPKPYLTMATYPVKKAFSVTKSAAALKGAITIPVGGGGIAVYNKKHPQHIFVAFPGVDYQVEVYDPNARAARRLVRAQSITPVR